MINTFYNKSFEKRIISKLYRSCPHLTKILKHILKSKCDWIKIKLPRKKAVLI